MDSEKRDFWKGCLGLRKKYIVPIAVSVLLLSACDININLGGDDNKNKSSQNTSKQNSSSNSSSSGSSENASNPSHIDATSNGFYEDYFHHNHVDGYQEIHIGMSLDEVEQKLGHRTGKIDTIFGNADVYGNYGIVYSDDKVVNYVIVPSQPISKSTAHNVYGDPSDEDDSVLIYDNNKRNGFAIFGELDNNGQIKAIGQVDDSGLAEEGSSSAEETVNRGNVIDRVESFEGHLLDTDKYTFKEPEKNGDDWGFSYDDKEGNLAGSYIIKPDGEVEKYDAHGDFIDSGY